MPFCYIHANPKVAFIGFDPCASLGYSCMAMFAALPSTIMEAGFGRLHNSGAGAFGAFPTVVESIMVDGKAANIAIQIYPSEAQKPMKAVLFLLCKNTLIKME